MGQYWPMEGRGSGGSRGRDEGRARADNVSSVQLAARRWCGTAHTHTFFFRRLHPLSPHLSRVASPAWSTPPAPTLPLGAPLPPTTPMLPAWTDPHSVSDLHLQMHVHDPATSHIKVCLNPARHSGGLSEMFFLAGCREFAGFFWRGAGGVLSNI